MQSLHAHAPESQAIATASEITGTEITEIIVTGMSPRLYREIARNVTLISADDLQQTPAADLINVLSNFGNITANTTTASDKFGSIDLRASGDTRTSNVLVLLDGITINSPDLSGADLSSISLPHIQRIEILRGGNSVRYGGNANGGVINIITEPFDQEQPARLLTTSIHSSIDDNDFNNLYGNIRAATTFEAGKFNKSSIRHEFTVNASAKNDEGHRDNNFLDSRFISGQYQLSGLNKSSPQLKLLAHHHEDKYGTAGLPVDQQEPTSASTPYDGGDTLDQQVLAVFRSNSRKTFNISSQVRLRERQNDFIQGFSPITTLSINDQTNSNQLRAKYADTTLSANLNERFTWHIGGQKERNHYEAFRGGLNLVDRSEVTRGLLENSAGFSQLVYDDARAKIELGYRIETSRLNAKQQRLVQDFTSCAFPFTNCPSVWEVDTPTSTHWHNEAFEMNALWRIVPTLQTYVNYAKTFRNPNTDELLEADEDLGPQQADQYELGFRWTKENNIIQYLEATTFYYETEDEILYGEPQPGFVGTNFNVDGITRRSGIELSTKVSLSPSYSLALSSGYTDAKIQKTQSRIPLAAQITHNASLRWQSRASLSANIHYQYVGDRTDGNDFFDSRRFEKLNSYALLNAKLIMPLEHFTTTLSVENLTNEEYSTAQYSGQAYPMPPRVITLGLSTHIFD